MAKARISRRARACSAAAIPGVRSGSCTANSGNTNQRRSSGRGAKRKSSGGKVGSRSANSGSKGRGGPPHNKAATDSKGNRSAKATADWPRYSGPWGPMRAISVSNTGSPSRKAPAATGPCPRRASWRTLSRMTSSLL